MRKSTLAAMVCIVIVFAGIMMCPVQIVASYETLESYEDSEVYYENVSLEHHARWQIFTENVIIPVGNDNGVGVGLYLLTQRWTDLTVWVYNNDSIGGEFQVVIPIYESGDGWVSHGMMAGHNQYIAPDNFEIWNFANLWDISNSQKYELPLIKAPIKQIQHTRIVTKTRTVTRTRIVKKRIHELLFS